MKFCTARKYFETFRLVAYVKSDIIFCINVKLSKIYMVCVMKTSVIPKTCRRRCYTRKSALVVAWKVFGEILWKTETGVNLRAQFSVKVKPSSFKCACLCVEWFRAISGAKKGWTHRTIQIFSKCAYWTYIDYSTCMQIADTRVRVRW